MIDPVQLKERMEFAKELTNKYPWLLEAIIMNLHPAYMPVFIQAAARSLDAYLYSLRNSGKIE